MSDDVPRPRWRRLHRICLTLVIVGCLLHLTIRDSIPFPVATIYYALPRPMLLMLALLACLTTPRRAWVMATVSLVLAGWVAWKDIAWNSPAANSETSHTVVFWNVGHDLEDDTVVIDRFLEQKPTVLGLVETGPISAEWLTEWSARHPEYDYAVPYQGMFLAVRGKLTDEGHEPFPYNSHAGWAMTEINGQRTRVVVVDIAANPSISRREPLLALTEWLNGLDDEPILMLGDFNTPVESVWLRGIHASFRETFNTAGSGYIPTWPSFAPVLKLDQIWINHHLGVSRAWQTFSWRSDHLAQWAEITVTESAVIREP